MGPDSGGPLRVNPTDGRGVFDPGPEDVSRHTLLSKCPDWMYGHTWIAKAADTSSTAPSLIIILAPAPPSSAGWKRMTTVPGSSASRFLSRLAAAMRLSISNHSRPGGGGGGYPPDAQRNTSFDEWSCVLYKGLHHSLIKNGGCTLGTCPLGIERGESWNVLNYAGAGLRALQAGSLLVPQAAYLRVPWPHGHRGHRRTSCGRGCS